MPRIALIRLRPALVSAIGVSVFLWTAIASGPTQVSGVTGLGSPTGTVTPEHETPAPTLTPTDTPIPTFTPTPTFTSTPTATLTFTPTSTSTPTPTYTATPTLTPTPHTKKDPRRDPWPKLTAADLKSIQDLIDQGKKQQALDKLVEIMKKYCCNFETMADGKPIYDPKLSGEGAAERKKGGRVRIGDDAFRSAEWLYSSLKHEMVHSQQWQDEEAAKKLGSNGREKEAYQREIDNAANTGISEAEKKDLQERLKTY